jgi:hypothetical protein
MTAPSFPIGVCSPPRPRTCRPSGLAIVFAFASIPFEVNFGSAICNETRMLLAPRFVRHEDHYNDSRKITADCTVDYHNLLRWRIPITILVGSARLSTSLSSPFGTHLPIFRATPEEFCSHSSAISGHNEHCSVFAIEALNQVYEILYD